MATFFDSQADARTAIKAVTGTTNNINITATTVDKYQLVWYGEIYAVVSTVYNMEDLVTSNDDFVGSPAQDILQQIEELIAWWHFLKRELWNQAMSWKNMAEWRDKIKEWRDMLKMIINKQMRLYDVNGDEFDTVSWSAISWPTLSTTDYEKQFSADQTY